MTCVNIFAYGSLLYEPELPDAIQTVQLCQLSGFRRQFNKWSHVRGCRPSLSRWPDLRVPSFFQTSTLNRSLVLGTEPGEGMIGLVQSYPLSVREQLLERLDRREGYRENAPVSESGYLRERVSLTPLDGGAALTGWTYVKNPTSPFYRPAIPDETVARILARATPRGAQDSKRKGLDYFVGIVVALRRFGVHDPDMETLWRVVAGLSDELSRYVEEGKA